MRIKLFAQKTILSLLLFFSVYFVFMPTTYVVASDIEENTYECLGTRSSDITWKYKLIDGKLYKRQFNASTSAWIGDWILV